MDRLLEQVRRHEGFRSKVYQCTAGKNTIGYGRNLDDVGVSHKEALDMLYTDLRHARKEVIKYIDAANHLDGVRLDVLINMSFNLGIGGLLNFKKMIAAIDANDYELASKEMMDSLWAEQVGTRAIELSEQMKIGEYQ